jgi:hypothetical protein
MIKQKNFIMHGVKQGGNIQSKHMEKLFSEIIAEKCLKIWTSK